MDKTYKITPGHEKKIANRYVRLLAIFWIVYLPLQFILLNRHTKFFPLFIGSCCGYVVMGFFIYIQRRNHIRSLKDTVYIVGDDSLSVTRPSSIYRDEPVTSVLWENIKSITDSSHSLTLKRRKGLFSNFEAIHLPKEIENFEELENIIRTKMAKCGT